MCDESALLKTASMDDERHFWTLLCFFYGDCTESEGGGEAYEEGQDDGEAQKDHSCSKRQQDKVRAVTCQDG